MLEILEKKPKAWVNAYKYDTNLGKFDQTKLY